MSEPQIYEQILHKIQINGVEEENTTVGDLIKENEMLKDAQKNFEKQFIKEMDYKSRIEKAVEFINKHKKEITKEDTTIFNEDREDKSKLKVGTFMWHVDKLLNILNGRSDE